MLAARYFESYNCNVHDEVYKPFLQTVKRVLRKALANKEDPYLALLALRATPISNNSVSPAAKLCQQ